MKRSVNFFRIKLILIIAIIVFPIALIILLCNTLSWHDFGDYRPSVMYENAPENTAYVDILVKLPEGSEDYVDFAEWKYKEVSIAPDSEIAKLNDDGYVSLSVHYAGCEGFSDSYLRLDNYGSEITTIKKRYGSFKAAYVDENGNVLGITKKARTRYDPQKPSSFSADGDTLIFTIWDGSPLQYFFIFVLSFGELLAIIALIVCNVLDIRKNKQPSSDEKV